MKTTLKSALALSLIAIILAQTGNAMRPAGSPSLEEIQCERFLAELDKAKTRAKKEEVKRKWKRKGLNITLCSL